MDDNTKENGKMENSMVKVIISQLMVKHNKAYGKKGNYKNGYEKLSSFFDIQLIYVTFIKYITYI